MLYRPLGQTRLRVSILGLGASPLGGVFGAVSQDQADRTVAAALEAGINFIDVSPFYGLTKAESALGAALRGVQRERFYLATKVGRYGADAFDFSAIRVTASVDESLRRLGLDVIDLIQCHDIEFGSIEQVIHETLPALERLRRAGKVRFIGVTGLPLAIFPRVLEAATVDTVLSYCHDCLNDSTLEALLPYLRSKGVGVINAAPLSMGLLSSRPLAPWHPAPPELKRRCAMAAEHCAKRGADLADLALRYTLAKESIDTTFVGLGSPEDVARNVRAVGNPPDETLLREVMEILAPVQGLTWPSGRAENN